MSCQCNVYLRVELFNTYCATVVILLSVGYRDPIGTNSPQGTGMGKKCPEMTFTRTGRFSPTGDEGGRSILDGEFPMPSLCVLMMMLASQV